MPAVKEIEVPTIDEDATESDAIPAKEIRFGEDSKFVQISINISFPFSSIVIPAGRRMSGGLFEFVRKAVPVRAKKAEDEQVTKESPPRRQAKRHAA